MILADLKHSHHRRIPARPTSFGYNTPVILFGQLLLPDPPRSVRLTTGTVEIADDQIVAVREGDRPKAYDLGGPDSIICPGLVDLHLHLPQFDAVGVHGLPLLEWLDRVIFPAEARWRDDAYARDATQQALSSLLQHGTTAFAGYATSDPAGAEAALSLTQQSGMRAAIGQVLMDRGATGALVRNAEASLAETAALLKAYPPGARVQAAVTPRFAVSCTADLLSGAGQLAAETRAVVQTHLAETPDECSLVSELFDGQRYVEVYQQAGLLGERAIHAHGIYLDDTDRQMLRDTQTIVAHCPTANSFLRSGAMDRQTHNQAGVRVALGSDIGGGYERSMIRVARAMLETSFAVNQPTPSVAEAWWQITQGNAELMGWQDTGVIRAGAEADLLVIQPDARWQDSPSPLGAVMFAWDDRWLTHTLVQGQVVWER